MVGLDAQLVKDTFENKFDEYNFRKFLSELFGQSINNKEDKTKFMGKGYSDYIKSVFYLGNYIDDEYSRVGAYIIELNKTSSINRARTMQRNVIAHFLRNSSDDCAIVAFYEENTPDWRFSFANLDYEFDENGVIKEKLAPAKRHSFLVGPNEPNYTCKRQFLDLLSKGKLLVSELEKAFNVENVTKEFFSEYRNLFHDLADSINEIIENDDEVYKEFTEKNIKVSDFAKKLLGQLVFLYFLQKKGWLGVPENGDWGDGPKNFMRKLFNGDYVSYKENKFFDDVIEPLFYQGLSEGVTDFHYSQFNFKVPFLNGGLFENISNYDWKHTDLVIPDAIFEKIFTVFDKFNFTVKEDEPLEKEVAVDPEMLGKVFENLLEVHDRKSKGAFYTPRYIVHYICQQTLISYLKTNTEDIPVEDLMFFIEKGHLALDSIIKVQEEARKYNKDFDFILNSSRINLPLSIRLHNEELDELLKNIKVVDPAVGSGAFPVGMMTEIVQAREVLNTLQGFETNLYDLKRETIENSLYGVDISSSAVDIAKLRFWLSLVVDEENMDNIRPLPNLDNHIMCGNSVVDNFNGVKLFDNDLIANRKSQTTLTMKGSEIAFKRLEKLKTLFFNENNPNEKRKFKMQINDIKWNFIEESFKEAGHAAELNEIRKYKDLPSRPFFIWQLEFSEIFNGTNPGFDIVIGNPPYVKEYIDKDAFDGLRDSPYYQGKMDLWTFFGSIAIDYAKDGGCVGFIAPNNWTTSAGASNFRNKVNEDAKILKFIDFGNYHVFESAGIQTMIYIMQKDNLDDNYVLDYSLLTEDVLTQDQVDTFLKSNEKRSYYKKYESLYDRSANKDSFLSFLDQSVGKIINHLINQENILYLTKNDVSTGIDVHQDFLNKKSATSSGLEHLIGAGIFVLTTLEKNALNLSEKECELIKPYYTSENMFRYYANSKNDLWIIYTKSDINDKINQYPNIKEHFDIFKEVITSDYKPYGLHRARNEKIFLGEKIIVTRKCIKPTFTYVDFDSYVPQTFNLINTDRINLKYLTGILNSKLIQFWLRYKGKMQGHNYQLDQKPLLGIPIKHDVGNPINEEIIDIVDKILESLKIDGEDKSIEDLEKDLNQKVYKLYNLSENDIQIVENNI